VPVAQGSLATLFGSGLATDTVTISSTTWPKTAVNRQLVVNDDLQAPIYYIGPKQVNFQVPSNVALGAARIAIRTADTGELVAGGGLLVSSAAPGVFTANQSGSGQAAVLNQDFTVNSATNPAPAGSIVSIYGTGQGQVSPAVPDGSAAGSSPLSNTVAVPTSSATTCVNNQPSMCVAFGSTFGDVKYSGLAPGYIGLWQINVLVPAGATGAVPVRVVINGTPSNLVSVAVR
jgi:adhesin/invasin